MKKTNTTSFNSSIKNCYGKLVRTSVKSLLKSCAFLIYMKLHMTFPIKGQSKTTSTLVLSLMALG